jgi:hypothetical protein
MPEDLWRAATDLAREHGAWATARAVGVRYDTLSPRVKELGGGALHGRTRFVELAAPALSRLSDVHRTVAGGRNAVDLALW